MQRAQPDDRSRHAGLHPEPLTRTEKGKHNPAGLFAHQRDLKPVCHQGKGIGAIREYSDTLLTFMLKARPAERRGTSDYAVGFSATPAWVFQMVQCRNGPL
jgi:hypothetical protein